MSNESKAYKELSIFIREKMRMSHIYQPLMIATLLSNNGDCEVSTIARAILAQDQSQIEYYGVITKNMVGRVLSNHGWVKKVKKGSRIAGYRLKGFECLSQKEITDLISICSEKIREYLDRRGMGSWSHRARSSGYVPGTMRWDVFKQAKFRCAACGISKDERSLEVDHIHPRSLGGSDEIDNFQALCYKCNRDKSNRDDEDLRGGLTKYEDRESGCLFCEIKQRRIVTQNKLCFAITDRFPVTDLHHLIIPRRHVAGYFDLFQPELNAIMRLLKEIKDGISKEDPKVTGFNVGVNCGEDAGQTVSHCHIHLIPRRNGDVANPAGGVRGVVPGKQDYRGLGGEGE